MKVVQNLKLSFFLGIWQRMIKISSFLLVNFVAEIRRLSTWKKLSTTRSRIKHSCPCTHRCAGPPTGHPPQGAPGTEEDSRAHAPHRQAGSPGKEGIKATPAQSLLPSSPISSSPSYLEVNWSHACYARSFLNVKRNNEEKKMDRSFNNIWQAKGS